MMMRTKDDTAESRHRAMMHALDDLEDHARVLGDPAANHFAKTHARTGLAAAALVYARRVRRMAGVR